MIVWNPAATRSVTFDPITKAVPMCMSPDGSSPTYARGVPVRSRRARNSSRVTTSSEPRNTVWRRSSRATDPPNLTRQDKGFNPQGGRLRHSNNGLKSRMRHPRPRIRMGGILGLFDLGSVTAFQGVDVVGAAVGAFIFLIFVLIFLFATLKVVKEYERIVNFRLGKAQAEKGPGIVVVIPGIYKPVRVDLRERYLTIPHQTCITKDNAPVDVDFIVYFKVASAADSVIRVNNFEGAAMGIATTTLRAVVGDIILDEVLSKREEINAILRTKLDEVTTRWGVKVTNVEIREILPPKNVTDAMILQMSAERSRRAVVIEADGRKTATVTVAVFLPSASMTTARRLRSADIWRIMASVTFLGGRISRISTFVTLTPQRVVTSSSFVRRIALISSRFERTSSRMMSPMTARRVVVAMPIAAPSKLFTRMTESAALATLKYTMKSTSTGALSFVIHVWCGIVR